MSARVPPQQDDRDPKDENEPPADAQADEAESLPKDDAFHLLQNARRRAVLRYVRERPEESTYEMRAMAERIAAWENDKSVQAITSDERQRVYIALYQSHLPKLDEFGVVEYDKNRGTVEPTPLADEIAAYLEAGDESRGASEEADGDRSLQYYGGATTVSALLAGASLVGLLPALLTSYLAALVTGLFAAVTLALGVRGGSRSSV